MITAGKITVIGGSAGSMPVFFQIIKALPVNYRHTIIIVLHRQRNTASEMANVLSIGRELQRITEPDDKEPIKQGCIYLAPQNYHLLVEDDLTFSLDYSEPIHYSRPSIDVSFESVAKVYKNKAYAVLLSGANDDGAAGLRAIIENNGTAIVQDPASAGYPAMPLAGIHQNKNVLILKPAEIANFIAELS